MHNYLKFFKLFVIIIIKIIRPPSYFWIKDILGIFLYVHQVIWNIWVYVKCLRLPYFEIKIFNIFGLRIYGLHSIFRSSRGDSNRGISNAAERGEGHQLVGVAKPQRQNPPYRAQATKAPNNNSPWQQNPLSTKAPNNNSPWQQKPLTTKEDLRLLLNEVEDINLSTLIWITNETATVAYLA